MDNSQKQVRDFMREMGWKYFSEKEILGKMKEELGEVIAEAKTGNQEKLELEIGDLDFAIACFCNIKKIHRDRALVKAIQKDRVRDKDRYTTKKKKKIKKPHKK